MNEMTLPFRHRIRNSNPGGLRPSSLLLVTEAPHNIKDIETKVPMFQSSHVAITMIKILGRFARPPYSACLAEPCNLRSIVCYFCSRGIIDMSIGLYA